MIIHYLFSNRMTFFPDHDILTMITFISILIFLSKVNNSTQKITCKTNKKSIILYFYRFICKILNELIFFCRNNTFHSNYHHSFQLFLIALEKYVFETKIRRLSFQPTDKPKRRLCQNNNRLSASRNYKAIFV